MDMDKNYISRELFDERQRTMDKILDSDKESIASLNKAVNDTVRITDRLVTRMEELDKDIASHGERITELEKKPGKRMDSIIVNFASGVIMLIIGSIFGYMMRGF